MSDKISILIDLYNWLAKYQIKEKKILGFLNEGNLSFELEHPTLGIQKILISFPKEIIFRINGIGLKIEKIEDDQVELFIYDHGGIYDPIDKRVMGEHYSATHFALMGAILFKLTGNEDYILPSKLAIDFHIRTSPDEYKLSSWGYHWDFNNYAFLETFNLLKDKLSFDERNKWMKSLKKAKSSINIGTNWFAMRAYFFLLKKNLINNKNFLNEFKYLLNIFYVSKMQKKDGCFDDFKNKSRPIQYHVYILALIGKMIKYSDIKKLKKMFLKGINYFLYFIDPKGDFNFKGRGQEQIFGYGAALYVLEVAKKIDRKNKLVYENYLKLIWSFMLPFKKQEGYFPLVLNKYEDTEKVGWYDYHHLTVYNAFFGVWLGFACLSKENNKSQDANYPIEKIKLFKASKVLIINRNNYYCVLSGGETRYLSDAGLTFHHLYIKDIGDVFSCPGGPSIDRYGKLNVSKGVEQNFMAPIACDNNAKWYIPIGKGKLIRNGQNEFSIILDYGPFISERKLILSETYIQVKDLVLFKTDIFMKEFRIFNFPLFYEKFIINIDRNKILLMDKNSGKNIIFIFKNKLDKLEVGELSIKNAKYKVKIIALIEYSVMYHKGNTKKIDYVMDFSNESFISSTII